MQGSKGWSFSAPDSYFDYLADGEAVTLTYTVEVDDHHGGVISQDIVVTINGSNDAPDIADIAQQGLAEQTDTAPLTTRNKGNLDPMVAARLSDASVLVVNPRRLHGADLGDHSRR